MKKYLSLVFMSLFLWVSLPGMAQKATPLEVTPHASKGSVVFFEDFLTGVLPEGWINEYSSGMAFDFTTSSSFSLTYNFSEQGFPDVFATLQSPAIDFSGYTKAELTIEHLFFIEGDHPAEHLAFIEISTNGNSWIPVVSLGESTGEPGGWDEFTYDIGHLIAGEPEVYVRFNFHVPAFVDAYYMTLWEIESISISGGTADLIDTLPWSEDFSSGDLPDGWDHQIFAGDGWGFELPPPFPHTVIYAFPGMDHRSARLVTPIFNLTNETAVTLGLEYNMYIWDPDNETTAQIQYSEDGINWIPFSLPNLDTGGEIVLAQYDLTSELAGKQFQLGLFVDLPSGIDTYEFVWEILQITLEGAPATTYTLSFEVTDNEGSELNDAIITVNDQPNTPGDYLFPNLLPGKYSYTIEKNGYYSVSDIINIVDEDVNIPVSLTLITFKVTLSVYDFNSFTINDATVALNGTAYQAGVYTFHLPPGVYNYVISKEGHTDATGFFEVEDANINLTIYLGAPEPLTVQLPLLENFDGLTSAMLPTGWHRTGPVWQIKSSNAAGGIAPEITYEFENDFDATGEDRLITPWINPMENEVLWLSIDHYLDDYLGDIFPFTASIEGTHDGINWVKFWEYDGQVNTEQEQLVLNISSMAGNPFQIAFVVELGAGSSSLGLNWHIDNILIEAEAIPEIYTATFEVDMSTAPGFNPETDQVYVTGSMIEWLEPGQNNAQQLMTRVDNSWIWAKSLEIEEGIYEYKYYIGSGWEGAEWEGEPNRSLILDGDQTLTDFWGFISTPPLVDLSLQSQPFGAGILTGAGQYYQNQTVTLTAQANGGYYFVNWTHEGTAISSQSSFEFLIPAESTTLTANFELISYNLTLTANPTTGGTVSEGGQYVPGEIINVIAQANEGYNFVNWTIENEQVSNELTFAYTMPAQDVVLVANFELIPSYILTITANPTGGGTVSQGGEYEAGETIDVSAQANEGYNFVNWTVGNEQVSNQASFTYTMPAQNVQLVANFELIPTYTLTITANPAEGGTVSQGGEYEAGETINVSAQANEGYLFINWTLNNQEVSNQSSLAYTMPAQDVELVANFELIPTYTLTLTASPSEGGTVSQGGEFEAGKTINVSAQANEGYQFVNWTLNNQEVSNQPSFDYTMPAQDVELVANFSSIIGVGTLSHMTLRVYPNPTNGLVHVDMEGDVLVRVLNINGILIYQTKEKLVDLSKFASGIYILDVNGTKTRVIKTN